MMMMNKEQPSSTTEDRPSTPPPSPSSSPSRNSDTSQVTVIANPNNTRADTPAKWVHFPDGDVGNMELSVEELTKRERPEPLGQSNNIGVAQIDVSLHQETAGGRAAQHPFENGKILTTILPENELFPWVVPARFNAYKMPKTLISDQLTMPVEDYVTAMELLTNDYRFRAYTVCYRRLISIWFVISLVLLLAFLLSSRDGGLFVFLMVLVWMFIVAVGLLVCLCVKKQIYTGLHHCVRSANKVLIRHNLLVGVEDRGKLSCHKIAIHFIYFRTSDCMSKIMQLISQYEQTVTVLGDGAPSQPVGTNPQQQMGIGNTVAPKNDTVALDMDRPESLLVERAKALILKYSQGYVKALAKKTIRFPTRPVEGVSEFTPRHCTKSYCLCQYLQKFHFERKEKKWYERFF